MVVRGDRSTAPCRPTSSSGSSATRSSIAPASQVTELHSDGDQLAAVTVTDPAGATERRSAGAPFICIGGEPRTGWAAETGVRTDRAGYILTGPDLLAVGQRPENWPLERDPLALETSAPGLFAAETYAPARPSGSPAPSARAPWPRRSSTADSTSMQSE